MGSGGVVEYHAGAVHGARAHAVYDGVGGRGQIVGLGADARVSGVEVDRTVYLARVGRKMGRMFE